MIKNNILSIVYLISGLFLIVLLVYYLSLTEIKKITINNKQYLVEVARTIKSQSGGLSQRNDMGNIDGMLFVYDKPKEQSFWMKDMRFDIDIAWIRNSIVVGLNENVPHSDQDIHYISPEEVDMVLELESGRINKDNISVGDIVYF